MNKSRANERERERKQTAKMFLPFKWPQLLLINCALVVHFMFVKHVRLQNEIFIKCLFVE